MLVLVLLGFPAHIYSVIAWHDAQYSADNLECSVWSCGVAAIAKALVLRMQKTEC